MINPKKVTELLNDRKTYWHQNPEATDCPIYEEKYIEPLINALGNDEEEVKNFLKNCGDEDLYWLSEIFEEIYEKFPNDDMYDFLDEMEIKAGLHN